MMLSYAAREHGGAFRKALQRFDQLDCEHLQPGQLLRWLDETAALLRDELQAIHSRPVPNGPKKRKKREEKPR